VTSMHRYSCRLVAVAMLVIVSAARLAHAQADDEIVDEVAANKLSPEQVAIVLDLGGQDLKSTYKAELAGWVAGGSGTKGGVRMRLEAELQNALAKLKAECHPTDSQLKKLELAGRGDIKRFMDRLNQFAVEFDTSRGEGDEIEMIETDVRKAKNQMAAGLFGADSLLFKTLTRSGLRYPVSVAQAVRELERHIGLNDRQRGQLFDLIVSETPEPRKYGKASELALVLCQASRIPAEKFARIMSAVQEQKLLQWISVYKEGAGSEAVLKRNGFVFEDNPAAARPQVSKPVAGQEGIIEVERKKKGMSEPLP
jgi:hypothetical protein